MHDEDFTPSALRKTPSLEAQLETASVEELEQRIVRLKAEIAQCEEAIKSKKAQRAAADSVFGARSN